MRFSVFLLEDSLKKNNYSSFGSGLELFGLILLCVFIVVCSYFVTKFVAGKQLKQRKESNFQVIDVCRISQNKVLQLIKVGDTFIVIAVCKDTVTYLMEVPRDEVVLPKEGKATGLSFKEMLSGLTKGKETTIKEVDTHDDKD